MNKEAAARYHAKPAAIQSLINDIRRTQYDDLDRRNLANEADFLVEEKYQAQASKAKSPGVVEAVRRSVKAHREGGASPIAKPLTKLSEADEEEAEEQRKVRERKARIAPLTRADLEEGPAQGELLHEKYVRRAQQGRAVPEDQADIPDDELVRRIKQAGKQPPKQPPTP